MRDVTRETLGQLSEYPWFSRVLEPLDRGGDGIQVGSWEEAVHLADGEVWGSVHLQIKNRLAQQVSLGNYERFAQWRSITTELRTALSPIVDGLVRPVAERHHLPGSFLESVRFDLTFICLETEYSDVCPPLFFQNRVNVWYRQGRFPCGWEGPILDEGWTGSLANYKLFIL